MLKPQIEQKSETWRAVEEYANERLIKLRLQNDSMGLDQIATANLRGKISVIKELLALANAPAIDADDSGFGL